MSPDGSSPKPPPEEKLLRLIRGKGKEPRPAAAPVPPAGGAASAASGGVGFSHEGMLRWSRFAVAGLGVVLIIEMVWLIIEAMRPVLAVTVPPMAATPSVGTSAAVPRQDIPSFAASASRPLFGSSAAATSPAPSGRTSQTTMGKQLTSRLTLVGIVSGNPPQAIIEDSEAKKNYFVSVGQAVADGAVLEQVLDNRVVLDLDGEKIELSL